jgi:thiamine biosynthesis lipoprotein
MPSGLMTALLGAVPAVLGFQPAVASAHAVHAEHVLGTTLDLAVVSATADEAQTAYGAARTEIARLDGVLSGWRDDSELAALNRSLGPCPVSHDLYQVIAACEAWRAETGGAFDGRLGAVEAAWDDGERTGLAPGKAALAIVSGTPLLDPAARTIDRRGVVFAVDALAKGYIVDQAVGAALRAAPSIQGLLLNIGGDMACRGRAPEGAGWRIGVAPGGQADNLAAGSSLRLTGGQAVASSGPGARDRRIGGKAFGRTLDPATGQPARARLTTVTADRAETADALATALSVMPTVQALAFAEARPGVEARIVDDRGVVHVTRGWSGVNSDAPVLVRVADKAPARPWPKDFVVSIGYTIYGGVEHPPMMVVYITDSHGGLVRNVGVIGKAPARFLSSNYVWYGLWRKKKPPPPVENLTHPTKPPGSYHVLWDGLDDAGRPVAQGRYTINIEASREKGGHGVQRIVLDLGELPTSGLADPAPEAGPASARYGEAQ